MKKTVVLGITSSIAAYKAIELVQQLRKDGVEVFVIMTNSASKMVSPADFEKASGHKVLVELFEKDFNYNKVLKTRKVEHIELADKADVMVIAPATANVIAKLAYGLADDYLTTTALAVTAPMIICPAMNVNMWNNPVVQANVAKLMALGYQIIEPEAGMLACGYEGKGRLVDVGKIKDAVMEQLNRSSSLKGRKIIVTAGGTSEKIDDIRSITNRSSGKMGVAIAEECYLRGADVLLFRARSAVRPRYLLHEEEFTSTEELFSLVKKYAKNYEYFYHVAAVSDFVVENQFKGKLSSKKVLTLKLKPQIKVLDQVKKLNPKIYLIAFKAEYGLNKDELVKVASRRLKEASADMIIANDISKTGSGFESDMNEVYIIFANGKNVHLPLGLKTQLSRRIVDYLPKPN